MSKAPSFHRPPQVVDGRFEQGTCLVIRAPGRWDVRGREELIGGCAGGRVWQDVHISRRGQSAVRPELVMTLVGKDDTGSATRFVSELVEGVCCEDQSRC